MKKKILGIVLSVCTIISAFACLGSVCVFASTQSSVAHESFDYMTNARAVKFFTESEYGNTAVTQAIVDTGKNSTKALAVTMNMPNSWNKADCQSSKIIFGSDVAGIKLWYNLNQQFTNFRLGLKNASTGEWTNIMFEGTAAAGATVAAGSYEKEIYFYSCYSAGFDYSSEYVLAFEAAYAEDAESADYVLTVDDFVFIKSLSTENFDNKEVGTYTYFVEGSYDTSAPVTASQEITAEGGADNTKALKVHVNNPGWGWMNIRSAEFSIPSGATGFHAWYKVSTDLTMRLQLRNNGYWTTAALAGGKDGGTAVTAGTHDHSCFVSSWQYYDSDNGNAVKNIVYTNKYRVGLEITGGLKSEGVDILIDNIMFVKSETYLDFNSLTDADFFTVNKVNTPTVSQALTDDSESGKALAVTMGMANAETRVNLVSDKLDIPYNASAVKLWYKLNRDFGKLRFGLKNITTGEWTNVMFVDGAAVAGTETKTLYFSGSDVTVGNNYALAIEAFGTNGVTEDYIIAVDNITFYTATGLINTNSSIYNDFESTATGTHTYFPNRNTDGADTTQTVVDGIGENGSKALKVTANAGGWYNIHSNGFKIPANVVGIRVWYNLSTDAKLRIQLKQNGAWNKKLAVVGGESGVSVTAGVHDQTVNFTSSDYSTSTTYNLGLELQGYAHTAENPAYIIIDNISFIYDTTSAPTNNFDNAAAGTYSYFTGGDKADSATITQTVIENGGMYGSKALNVKVAGGWVNYNTDGFKIPSGAVGMHAWYTVSASANIRFMLKNLTMGAWTDMAFIGAKAGGVPVTAGTYDKTFFFSTSDYNSSYSYSVSLEVTNLPDDGIEFTLDAIEFIYATGAAASTDAQFNAFTTDIDEINNFDAEDYLKHSLTAYNEAYKLVKSIPAKTVANTTLKNAKEDLAAAKTSLVMKAEQKASVAPALAKRTSTTIKLAEVAGCEYSIDGVTWANTLSYTDLTKGNTYTVYQRMSRTDTHLASNAATLQVKLYAEGDINNDDSVNAADLVSLKKHLLGFVKTEEAVFDNFSADANIDDTVDIRDLIKIKKITSGEVA